MPYRGEGKGLRLARGGYARYYSYMQKNLIYIGGIIFIVCAAIYVLASNRPGTGGRTDLDGFASCLKDKGAVFYGAFWCSHCQDQKTLFGTAVKLMPYVECSTPDSKGQTAICVEKGVKNYPTWIFADGSREVGEMDLETLAARTGCTLPQ